MAKQGKIYQKINGILEPVLVDPKIDTTLSTTSTNAVQNKVIKAELDKKQSTEYAVKYGDILHDYTFMSRDRIFQSKLDDVFYKADVRYTVSLSGFTSTSASNLFDGNCDTFCRINPGNTGIIDIQGQSNFSLGYPYGYVTVAFYASEQPVAVSDVTFQVYQEWEGHNVGWVTLNPIIWSGHNDYQGTPTKGFLTYSIGQYGIKEIKITITNSSASAYVSVATIEYFANRTSIHNLPVLTKWGNDTIYGNLTLANNGKFIGDVTGNADTTTKLKTARSLKTNLGSTTAVTFDGNTDQNNIPITGTLSAGNGGTGQTSLINACNSLLNALSTGSSDPVDNDYYISQYVNGGNTTTTYHRRPVSKLYNYIKSKTDTLYLALSGGSMTGTVKWNSTSLPNKTGSAYAVVIDAFASGGEMGWRTLGSGAFMDISAIPDATINALS